MSDIDTTVAQRTNPGLGLDPMSQAAAGDDANPSADTIVQFGADDDSADSTGDSSGDRASGLGDSSQAVETADAPDTSDAGFVEDERWSALVEKFGEQFEARAGTPPVDPASTVEGEGADGVGGEVEGVGSGDLAPDPATAPPVVNTPTSTVDPYFGIPQSEAQQVLEWAKSLTPEQVQQVNAVLTQGQSVATGHNAAAGGVVTPQVSAPPAVGQPGMPIQDAVSNPTATPGIADLGVIAEVAPEFAASYVQMQQTLAQMQGQFQSTQQEQARLAGLEAKRHQEQVNGQIEQGMTDFKSKYPNLSDQDIDAISRRAASMQIMPTLVQKNQGAVDRAFVEALDTAMWSDPGYRERAIQAQVNTYAQTNAQTEVKRGKAAQLGVGGGSVPRNTAPPDPSSMTPEQRQAAMRQIIADGLN